MAKKILLTAFGLTLMGCFWLKAQAQAFQPDPVAARTVNQLRAELPALNLDKTYTSAAFKHYLQFYHLDLPQTQHYAGYFNYHSASLTERIFVHLLKPVKPRGTVLLLHGYFVHSGIQRYIIQDLLRQNFSVLAIDLPGHGLSTGPRAAIDNFSHYAGVIEKLTQSLISKLQSPLHLIAHSTGGAGVIEYLLSRKEHPYHKVVLAAPLVRSYLWDMSRLGFDLGHMFIPELPRVIRSTTNDPEFMAFVLRDPLQYMATPTRWVAALFRWHENTLPYLSSSQHPVLILQGTDDTVLEWEYNLTFLAQKFPRAKIIQLPGASHDLFWESAPIRKVLFQHIEDYLQQPE